MTTQTLSSTFRCDTAIAHTPLVNIKFRFKSAWVDEHARDMAEYTTVKVELVVGFHQHVGTVS